MRRSLMCLHDRKRFMMDTVWLVVVSLWQTAACDLLWNTVYVITAVSAVEFVGPVVVGLMNSSRKHPRVTTAPEV